ncbi:MAG: T9SS type A sorting domain-containing protein [Bacteroidetes bacterium]|nr:T9SS type A sorting domain-containing protein [Bacteroidota bacterium]MBL7103176.1 T9SS type A sorting domain-containing protein [Bacteroidales bacterium]
MILLKIICKINIVIVISLSSINAFAQTNTIKILTDLGTNYDYSYSIAFQDDGKVIVAGDAWGTPCLIRFDTTGGLDNTFGIGGKVFTSWNCSSNPADNDIRIQQDGKIILGTRYYNGSDDDFILARFNSDGSPDLSFGDNGQVISSIGSYNDWCNAIAIQPDGKILAAGGTNNAPASNYNYNFALIRYNADGSIDSTFGNNGITITNIGLSNNIAYSMVIQQNNKIILVGEANDSIFSDFALARYKTDGSLDSDFGNGGIVRTPVSTTYDFAKSIDLQPDGKILVAGSAQSSLSNYNFALVRYELDGSLDNTFGVNGIVLTDIGSDFGEAVTIQPDEKIILAGSFTNGTIYDFATLRYNNDGALDYTFGTNGLISTSFGNGDSEGKAVTLGNDGEIIVTGSYNPGSPNYFDFAMVRLFSSISIGFIDIDENLANLLLYPNPTQSDFEINYSLRSSQEVTILLRDIQGKIIQRFTDNQLMQSGNHTETFYLNNSISSGQYFLEIRTSNYKKSIKIIKK